MLGTVTPLGERARGNRYGITAASFILGAVAGGAMLGIIAAFIGGIVLAGVSADSALQVLAAATAVAAAIDLAPGMLRRIPPRRQVDDKWVYRLKGWAYGIGFGAQLGFSVVTVVYSAQILVAIVASALSMSPVAGLAIGLVLGLSRGLPILLGRRIESPGQLLSFGHGLDSLTRKASAIVRSGAVLVSIVLTAVLLGR